LGNKIKIYAGIIRSDNRTTNCRCAIQYRHYDTDGGTPSINCEF